MSYDYESHRYHNGSLPKIAEPRYPIDYFFYFLAGFGIGFLTCVLASWAA